MKLITNGWDWLADYDSFIAYLESILDELRLEINKDKTIHYCIGPRPSPPPRLSLAQPGCLAMGIHWYGAAGRLSIDWSKIKYNCMRLATAIGPHMYRLRTVCPQSPGHILDGIIFGSIRHSDPRARSDWCPGSGARVA